MGSKDRAAAHSSDQAPSVHTTLCPASSRPLHADYGSYSDIEGTTETRIPS